MKSITFIVIPIMISVIEEATEHCFISFFRFRFGHYIVCPVIYNIGKYKKLGIYSWRGIEKDETSESKCRIKSIMYIVVPIMISVIDDLI